MRGLRILAILFGVLSIVSGVWAIAFAAGAAEAAWVGIDIFYACVGLFVLSLIGRGLGSRGSPA